MSSVLFVCTHNLCRSPLASALFQAMLESSNQVQGWRVESAGTWARENESAAAGAVTAAMAWGLDLTPHRSRCVSRTLLQSFNLVLTMEQGHKEALRVEFPDLAKRVYLLSEMAGAAININDPPGDSPQDYQSVAREIEQWLSRGFDNILARAGKPIPA